MTWTNAEKRADDLRRRHAKDAGLDVAKLLPWRLLQDSEKRRWLREQAKGSGAPSNLSGFTPASADQRAKVKGEVSITGEPGPCDPAHLTPRKHGGCDDPLCTVPLTRAEHRAFDDGKLDILPYLIAGQRWEEIGHMTSAHRMDPFAVIHRLTGQRIAPVPS